MENVFSSGELHVQKLAKEDHIAKTRTHMAMNNQLDNFSANFIHNQLLFHITSMDKKDKVWVSSLVGKNNLIEIIDAFHIKIIKKNILSSLQDVLYTNIQNNKEVGLLFIDWETSRRFRLNGQVTNHEDCLSIRIQEVYGICPKYIQQRKFKYVFKEDNKKTTLLKGFKIEEYHKAWVEKSNTFFLGTQGLSKKADASHKGGKSGFVKFINSNTIRIPDYPGNSMFNSLGNLHENPKAGLIFTDYELNETLQLTGNGKIEFNQLEESDLKNSGNTGRFWLFTIDSWIHTKNANPIEWSFINYSPFNP